MLLNSITPPLFKKIANKAREVLSLDLRSLAFFRIGIALILIADVLLRARDTVAHYSDNGILPRSFAVQNYSAWSINFISGNWEFQAIFFIVSLTFLVMLLLGYKTKLSTLVSWILLLSIQNRNPLLFQKSDDLLRLGLLWGFFLQWGEYYSIDSALNKPSEAKPRQIFTVATVAYFVQIIILYWTAALYKTSPIWHREGSAIFYALAYSPNVTWLGHFMLTNVPAVLLQMITRFVWWLELLGSFLLVIPFWNPLFRLIAILGYSMFHVGIIFTMSIGVFPWVGIVLLLPFVPRQYWDWLSKRLVKAEQRGIKLYYDEDCGFCKKSVRMIAAFLFLKNVELIGAQRQKDIFEEMNRRNSWIIVVEGEKYYRFDGFLQLLSASPVFRVFGGILRTKTVKVIGDRVYLFVASHRKRTCNTAVPIIKPEPRWHFYALQSIAALFLIIIVLWTGHIITNGRIRFSNGLKPIAFMFRLDQKWDMFAPFPYKDSFWYLVPGKLKDGTTVDVFSNGAKPNYRWRNYLFNVMYRDINNTHRSYFSKYLCEQWNSSHDGNKAVDEIEIMVMYRKNDFTSDIKIPPEKSVSLFTYNCFNQTIIVQ